MTYFEGFIVAVPEGNRDAFVRHANSLSAALADCGVQRQVECWGNDLPDGKVTDFKKAVAAERGETAVFAWFEYADRKARDASNDRMRSNADMMEMGGEAPFDARRMIFGGFEAVVEEGTGGGTFVDGIIVPVPTGNRDEYARLAGANAKVFIEYGATRVVETLGDDVDHGKVTDFYRAVKAEDGETIAFSFIEWPDKAARDQGWQKIMADQRMQHGSGVFDGSRMFWGGFDVIVDTRSQEGANR